MSSLSQSELKRIDEKICSELTPLLDGLATGEANFEQFKRAYLHYHNQISRPLDTALSLNEESQKLPSDAFYLFTYLGLVESLGNSVIDLVVLLLVANGRDFHIECQHTTPRIKHAVSIEDLETERVPLTTKLNFIRDNNLSFLASIIDTDLRNSVAHLKFEVKDGRVYMKGKKGVRNLTRKNMEDITSRMVRGTAETATLITEFMREKGVKP